MRRSIVAAIVDSTLGRVCGRQRLKGSVQRAAKSIVLVAALLSCAGAYAETPAAPTAPSEPWLLGNWGGIRTRLYEKGVDLQLGFVGEFAYNAAGGSQSIGSFTGQVLFGATFDLEKLVSLPKTKMQVTYTSRLGRNLVDDAHLDTISLVQEVRGRGQTVRLTQLFLEHRFFEDLLTVRWGRVAMGDAFAAFSCDFQNLTFCGSQPGNIVGNYIYNWPISQWGAIVKLNVPEFGYVQAGIYDVNGSYLTYETNCGRSGIRIRMACSSLSRLRGCPSSPGIPRRH